MSTDQTMAGPDLASTPNGWIELFRRFSCIAGGYWGAGNLSARMLVAALVVLTAAQVAVQVALNIWTERLFDTFGTRAMDDFLMLAGAFALILIANLTVTTAHLKLRRRLQIGWRMWLAHRLAGAWMASGRHYRMAQVPGDHDNPDGRLSEDVRIATEAAVDLAHSLLYCIMLLASFIHILWTLSGVVSLRADDWHIDLPGHLVWVALAYAFTGSAIALLLGSRLVVTAEARQTYEANLRFGLVHARENSSAIAVVHGEVAERRRFGQLLRDVGAAWARQTEALFRLMIFSSIWTVLSPVFPILVSAPRYIAGTITLGVLMQIAQAFQQVVSALCWPIDNLAHVAEWRASAERILGLQRGIQIAKSFDRDDGHARIRVRGSNSAVLSLSHISIVNSAGEFVVRDLTMDITPGERVWIRGEQHMISAIAKVLTGMWTWGSGTVDVPYNGPLYFLPQMPYLPLASLRDVVSYPSTADEKSEAQIRDCLRKAGLHQLIDKLSETEIWGEILPLGQQQRLGVARLLFHRPRWIIIEEPLDALGVAGQSEMMHLIDAALPEAGIVLLAESEYSGIPWRRISLAASSAIEAFSNE